MAATETQQVKDEIDRVNEALRGAFDSQNADAVIAFFSDEAELFPPDGRLITGRDGLRQFAVDGFAQGLHDVVTKSATFIHDGTLAVDSGISTFVMRGADGKDVEADARYLMVFRQQPDGRWLIERDSWAFIG